MTDTPPVTLPVAVGIVLYNEADDLPGCLEALAASEPPPAEVVFVDNDSRDDGVAIARAWTPPPGCRSQVVELGENTGFAHGMNVALSHSTSPWFLTLNADARLEPETLRSLVTRGETHHPGLRVGSVTPRLSRLPDADGTPRLDACGMHLTRTWRHLDRGSGEVDEGQFATPERVFGGTGAATLFRRAAVEDAAVAGEVFDRRFHTYREDAELAFRLRERGWEVLYEPAARCLHRRRVLPERRRDLPAFVNYHSLKNRYLLRLYHQTPGNALRTLVPTLARDVAALAYALVFERTSLPAYRWLWRHRRALWDRRRKIQGRRTVPPSEIDRWFRHDSLPLPETR